jgi:hypothetical protein
MVEYRARSLGILACCLVICIIFGIVDIIIYVTNSDTRQWNSLAVQTTCNISSSRIISIVCGDAYGYCYDGLITLSHLFDDISYSYEVAADNENENELSVQDYLDTKYPLGGEVTCYFNLLSPSQIRLGYFSQPYATYIGLTVMVCLFGSIIISIILLQIYWIIKYGCGNCCTRMEVPRCNPVTNQRFTYFCLVVSIIAAIGLIIAYGGVYASQSSQRQWNHLAFKTNCNITSSRIISDYCGDAFPYCYDGLITIGYTVYNKSYEYEIEVYDDVEYELVVQDDLDKNYPVGTKIICYYNSLSPNEVRLDYFSNYENVYIILLSIMGFFILLTIICSGMACYWLKKYGISKCCDSC